MFRRQASNIYWGSFVLDWFSEMLHSNLVGSDYKILFYLCEAMKYDDNTTYVKQKEIAEQLHMDKGNVSKSIKRLRDNQFIAKCDSGFMVNPHLFYVGKRRREMRIPLREQFDELLAKENRSPIYYLNEDEYVLEVDDTTDE